MTLPSSMAFFCSSTAASVGMPCGSKNTPPLEPTPTSLTWTSCSRPSARFCWSICLSSDPPTTPLPSSSTLICVWRLKAPCTARTAVAVWSASTTHEMLRADALCERADVDPDGTDGIEEATGDVWTTAHVLANEGDECHRRKNRLDAQVARLDLRSECLGDAQLAFASSDSESPRRTTGRASTRSSSTAHPASPSARRIRPPRVC